MPRPCGPPAEAPRTVSIEPGAMQFAVMLCGANSIARPRTMPSSPAFDPVLILIGEADDWTPADRCREMDAHARPDSAPITLQVYPDAHHAFDIAVLKPGRRALGHW